MNRFLAFITFIALAIPSMGQNIPHSNFNGPYGVQVNTYNGNLYLSRNDLHIPNQGISLSLDFAYNSRRDTVNLGYGQGWSFDYAMHYYPDSTGIVLEWGDGRRDFYDHAGGSYQNPAGIFGRFEEYDADKFALTTKYGMKYYFDDAAHRKLTRIEDTNGNYLGFSYAGSQLSSITGHSGRALALEWEAGLLREVADNNGSPPRQILYEYDAAGRLTKAINPLGGAVVYRYNETGRLSSMANENGDELAIFYNSAGAVARLASCFSDIQFKYNPEQGKTYVTQANQGGEQVTVYAYDEAGKLIQKKGSCCGYNINYEYDPDNNVSRLTDANGNAIAASHDEAGNALYTADPAGASQSFAFSPDLNRLTSLTDKRGYTTTFEYDASGNLLQMNQPENVQLNFSYDEKGNLASMADGNGEETFMDYNANNDLIRLRYPIGEETFEYDNVGNLLKSTDGNGNAAYYGYDALDRLESLSDDLGNTVRYEYDPASNLTKETDANNNEKQFAYDGHNRLESVTTPSGTTRYGYDAADNLTSITDANEHRTAFQYDTRNLLTEERDPLGNITSYSYDGNGNLISKTDANGDVTAYAYDALNRLVRKSYRGNTDHYEYDENGNLISCSNDHVSYSFTYDGLNRLVAKSFDNWGKYIFYEYDNAGNRITMTDPDGGLFRYEYDANNRLTRITNPDGAVTTFTYDGGGRLTRQDNHNGTYTQYQYDIADRLLSLENRASDGSILSSYAYTHDNNGNRLTMTDNNGGTANYQYDGDNRLTYVSYANGMIEEYSFDAVGNRTLLTRDGNATTYNYDAADRIQNAGTTTYEFDNKGNLIRKASGSEAVLYEYDGENKLTKASLPGGVSVSYQYDPLGSRFSRSDGQNTTYYLLDGENVLLELDAQGNTIARYTSSLSLDSWVSMQRGGQAYYYHTDGLGSITALTGASGEVVAAYEYDAYGNILTQAGAVENPYTYTGREWDAATGLYYYRTRYYDAEVGRFLTRDGFEGVMDQPLGLNKYNYVESNPIIRVDPTGEAFFLAPLLFTALKGVAIAGAVNLGLQIVKNVASGRNAFCIDQADVVINALLGALPFLSASRLLRGTAGALNQSLRQGGLKSIRLSWIKNALNKLNNKLKKIYRTSVPDPDNDFFREQIRRGIRRDLAFGSIGFGASALLKFLIDNPSKFCDDNDGNQSEGEFTEENGIITIPILRSFDPNEILAPEGCGPEKWVSAEAELPYTILFENDPDFATAPAQQVVIEHYFDDNINPFSFELGDFGFGDYYFQVPRGVSFYNTEIDLSDPLGVVVDVVAGIDVNTNRAFWIFESKDPATGLLSTLPADVGFLPINDTLSRAGEGFVNFTVKPWSDSQTGEVIEAMATITFDDNPPINTNLAFNTIDADHPVSAIETITAGESGNAYLLEWSGTDEGVGLIQYTLYVSTNSGPFLPKVATLEATRYTFAGHPDSTYRFFVIAEDCVGNTEPLKSSGEPACMQVEIVNQEDATQGNADGVLEVSVEGNIGPVTFTWPHDPNLSGPVADNIPAGQYELLVADTSGCQVGLAFDIGTMVGTEELSRREGTFLRRIYPVPARREVAVDFYSTAEYVVVELFSPAGKRLLLRTVEVSAPHSVSTIWLNIEPLPAGPYMLRLNDGENSSGGVFLKE
ncbi:MAG: RHS repeat protein [Lewinellaceae bacterium]|nr:RHS repeat protein [Lewinellaceae bacterium]